MKKIILFVMVLLTAIMVNAKDIKRLYVTTNPQMHCEGCEEKIRNQLKFEKGVRMILTNVGQQFVQIDYDAEKTTKKKLIKSLAKAGYTATEIPTPECCKPADQKDAQKAEAKTDVKKEEKKK